MDSTKLARACLFDIQGFSVHDGPGCRTLIFLKGCPLRCIWCSNPEGNKPFPEPVHYAGKCTFDKACINACKEKAVTTRGKAIHVNRNLCASCAAYACADACCSGALKIAGKHFELQEIITLIQRDRQFWGSSGGITLTGGEPFHQPDFTYALTKWAFGVMIHVAVETCGHVSWLNISRSLPYIDWIFYDLKHLNPLEHKKLTGSSNRRILSNARKLAESFKGRLIFRLPVIPGFNDGTAHIVELARFILESGRREINILPLHHLGREKYTSLNREYTALQYQPPDKSHLEQIKYLFEKQGITCYPGSDTPF